MAIVPPPNRNQDIARAMAQADQMRRAGRLDDAERICRAVLAAHPDAVPALNFLGLLLGNRGELAEAETLMRRALKAAPREAVLHNNLGNVLHKTQDIAGAEAAYRAAIALKPDYVEAHYNHGLMLRELGRPDEALAAQRQAAALNPRYTEALTQIGFLLTDKGEREAALLSLDAAIAANPNYFGAHYYRGKALVELSRYEDAIAALQTAVSLRPQSYDALYSLGNALNLGNRETEALEYYRKAIEASPASLLAHVDFNKLAWTMGRKDLQYKSFAFARSRNVETPELLLLEAEQRLRFSEAVEAEKLLRRAQQMQPERGEIANALGRSLTIQGRFAESIGVFENAIVAQPEKLQNYQELAITLLHERRPQDVIGVAERALAVQPYDQLSLGLLTLAYRETGDERLAALADAARYVGVYDIPPPAGYADTAEFNRELAEELAKFHTRQVEPYDQTLRGGTQTMGQLFTRHSRPVQQLRDRIAEAISDYIARMPDDPTHPFFGRKQEAFSFSGSWSCRLRSAGFHTNHVHPEGWISSAYYVALPDAVADESAQQGWIKFGESYLRLGERDRPSHAVQPAVGKLVLFPSYFWHGTVPFRSDDVRLTVAFDVVPGTPALRPY